MKLLPSSGNRFVASLFLASALFSLFTSQVEAQSAPAIDVAEGDRVLFLGDTLLERENDFGALETRLTVQFASRHFTVRNLAFSADTPLGISRASFDPPGKGFERLKEQLALVRPTLVILGYGMAASLQELTDRSPDVTLNADPQRYGRTPMSAERFKGELGQLIDTISAVDPAAKVRFIFLSPLRHEDLRASRPGLPDPAAHNRLLEQYTRAVQTLAQERSATFLDLRPLQATRNLTENGIHLTPGGYRTLAQMLFSPGKKFAREAELQTAILRKNALFFHRTRPANSTYLFGFRKGEQGNNAKEIPMFDPLIAAADNLISALAKNEHVAASPLPEKPTPLALQKPPEFTVAAGYQIELWAENPLLEKPVQENFDPQGRLWVASSSLYPQIEPGVVANDKILILEDTKKSGRANKSTVFAEGLLIPTAVVPQRTAQGHDACYVGQSTELLYFEDLNGDGKADTKRVVLSGFGTEDTHHIIHTLTWSPDGRLNFNQSIYIHSHIETPWGVVRLNSGGILSWDPRTEKVEVFAKGWTNSWGHQFDSWGQSFASDGAGSSGVSWAFPGATFYSYEGARETLASVSPGSYPKFCSLELISSPQFGADWQGHAITCDFRAHRIVRFGLTDLATSTLPQAGYITRQMPDVVRTTDLSFRPIDLKLGPDGALYVADWSNPVINHGEVDFRDPRRDKHHGRIWRISRQGVPLLPWQALTSLKNEELFEKLKSANLWEREQARRVLVTRPAAPLLTALPSWLAKQKPAAEAIAGTAGDARLEAFWLETALGNFDANLLQRLASNSQAPGERAMAARALGTAATPLADPLLASLSADPHPRVRLEALRSLARRRGPSACHLILASALQGKSDRFLEHAAYLSMNEVSTAWAEAVLNGSWSPDGHDAELEFGLESISPDLASQVLGKLIATGKIDLGKPSWFALLGRVGGSAELGFLYDSILRTYGDDCCGGTRDLSAPKLVIFQEGDAVRAADALLEAARLRNARPTGELLLAELTAHTPEILQTRLARLAGLWKTEDATTFLPALAQAPKTSLPVRLAAVEGLRNAAGGPAIEALGGLLAPALPPELRQAALVALTQLDLTKGVGLAPEVFAGIAEEKTGLETWRALLQLKRVPETFLQKFNDPAWAENFPKAMLAPGLRAARERGKTGEPLAVKLQNLLGASTVAATDPKDLRAAAESAKTGDPDHGELVFRRSSSGCLTCHAIGGAGGKVGPELTSLGASAPMDYIVESVVLPNAKVKEGYNAITVTLQDGTAVSGIQVRETAEEIFLRNVVGQETPVVKAKIASRTNLGSIMPSGLVDALPPKDRQDLYAFLGQLGRPGRYDASQNGVARVWRLYPETARAPAIKGAPFDGSANAFTLVDGRLLAAQIADGLQLVTKPGHEVFATTQFQMAKPGPVSMHLTGVKECLLDGQPLAENATQSVTLSAGLHSVTVRIQVKALPPTVKLEIPDAQFLTEF